jgi:hypothetical protein
VRKKPPASDEEGAGETDPIDAGQLVPWVHLRPDDPK